MKHSLFVKTIPKHCLKGVNKMKKFGQILFIISIISTICIIGADDLRIAYKQAPSFESLLIKLSVAIILMIVGLFLIKRGEQIGSRKEL